MKYLPLLLLLAGCSTIGGNSEVTLKALENLRHCDRTYTAAIGAGASGSVHVSCKAEPFDGPKPLPESK